MSTMHHPEDALPFFERTLALNPHLAETHNNRGQAFVALGHLPDARDSFIRAISLQPGRAEFYHGLASCTRFVEDDPHFRATQTLGENLSSSDETEQTQLHFALAKSHENQSRYEQAFAHLSAGNASRRRRMEYDETAVLERKRRFKPAFDPAMMRRAPSAQRSSGHSNIYCRYAAIGLNARRADSREPPRSVRRRRIHESRMRENRTYGSEGGEAKAFPTPINNRSGLIGNRSSSPLSDSQAAYGAWAL